MCLLCAYQQRPSGARSSLVKAAHVHGRQKCGRHLRRRRRRRGRRHQVRFHDERADVIRVVSLRQQRRDNRGIVQRKLLRVDELSALRHAQQRRLEARLARAEGGRPLEEAIKRRPVAMTTLMVAKPEKLCHCFVNCYFLPSSIARLS